MQPADILTTTTQTLTDYASKGFFNTFSTAKLSNSQATYHVRWHFQNIYELILNTKTNKLSIPVILPNVPARSAMDKDFRAFIKELSDTDLPEHRRIPSEQLKVVNKNKGLSLIMTLPKPLTATTLEQSIEKFISSIHQVFKFFLKNGNYDDYVAQTYGIDSDSFW